jgi:hypothetical protein
MSDIRNQIDLVDKQLADIHRQIKTLTDQRQRLEAEYQAELETRSGLKVGERRRMNKEARGMWMARDVDSHFYIRRVPKTFTVLELLELGNHIYVRVPSYHRHITELCVESEIVKRCEKVD